MDSVSWDGCHASNHVALHPSTGCMEDDRDVDMATTYSSTATSFDDRTHPIRHPPSVHTYHQF